MRRAAQRLGEAALVLCLGACSLLDRTPATGPAGDPTDAGESGHVISSPSSSQAEAIPDPLQPLVHHAGEEVEIPGATVVYLGLESAGTGVRARFRVIDGSPTGTPVLLLPRGETMELDERDGRLESSPFTLPRPSDQLTLAVGDVLVVFEAGSPS